MTLYGFETQQGSLYIRDPEGRTKRFKISRGKGHGEWHALSHCLFIPKIDTPLDLYHPGQRIDLGVANWPERIFTPFKYGNDGIPLPHQIQIGFSAGILVQNRDTGKITKCVEAQFEPALGLTPVEKHHLIVEGNWHSNVHIGNPVARVFTSVSELVEAAKSKGIKSLNVPQAYADQLKKERAARPDHLPQPSQTQRAPT